MSLKTMTWCTTFISLCLVMSTACGSDTRYGEEEVSNSLSIRIADLTGNPDKYVDKLVKIEGLVDDVCPMKGCWIDILEEQSEETMTFKVQDDVIVFPAEAKGHQITAEGYLRKHAMSREQAIRRMRHFAEEKGEEFDENSVKGSMVFYQIEGIGAVIHSNP